MKTLTQTQEFRIRLLTLITLCTALAACGGGGGGGGGNEQGRQQLTPREPQTIVFTDNTYSQDTLYLSADDGSTSPKPITSYGKILDFARSPDGGFVAFRVDAGGGNTNLLYLADINGHSLSLATSKLNNVTAKVSQYHWSPTSNQLIFVADGQISGKYELYLTSVYSTERYRLLMEDPELISGSIRASWDITSARWSPNGQFVAYAFRQDQNAASALNVHNVQGATRNSIRLSWGDDDTPSFTNISSFKWAPDSSLIAFRSDRKAINQPEIFIAKPTLSQQPKRANGEVGSSAYLGNYQWSPDSRYLAETLYSMSNGNYIGLNTWDTTTNESVRVASAGKLVDFAWTHNDVQLLFVDNHEASNLLNRLYVYTPASKKISRSVHGGNDAEIISQFQIAPNDSGVAYVTDNGLYKIGNNLDAPSDPIFPGTDIKLQSWSPTSKSLLFTQFDNSLFAINMREANPLAILLQTVSDSFRQIRWSNDGRRVVFSAGSTTPYTLTAIAPDASASIDIASGLPVASPSFDY